ncbi:sigma-70 family RNA polymerase sigma factor [Mycobacteroides chelonae]|uniref:sigma-70 family RNA polymerase sigma factor n=1 Tax=Mycobacteroides chelonae TaxID=1774 RepID=UPI0004AAADB8|nr:sigma-70 family RNA polymerase sigma factor [Mycobacteroides chelonae]MBF9318196.1 sigma-70 family RNA polymerase sigma factor [Mycobacteroides chelonae]OHT72337.1 RNA polymerase subunit sigma-70 [Mycobacteroides chelonae]OHT75114.1 RNA polymerase subunit sigma-70 [Mycobacteroides chelonae]OHT90172.1 RNA polymerase subunit sigma-70 [Mycobacteroides chelonae]
MDLTERFQAARPRLLSVAHRILGSHHDAEDAVQAAWIRAQSADLNAVDSLDAWLTTVTARLCLDQLRVRERHGEILLTAEHLPGTQLGADEDFLKREQVSRALLVVLGELSPKQRVAYVLHDLFSVPFEDIAAALDTTAASAKKLASRARLRLDTADPVQTRDVPNQSAIVDAFLSAARGGNIERLITLMAPDVVRTVDRSLIPSDAATLVQGARAVAEETRTFVDRIAVATTLFVDGRPGAVIAPGGHPLAIIRMDIRDGLITRIDIALYARNSAVLSI